MKATIWPWLTLFFISVILIGFLPYLLTADSWHNIDFSATGQIGDTIGGIIGPFVAVVAAFLTFIAFWVQYDANQSQRQDLQIERFESKFYELLHLHRANVLEMNIAGKTKGRKCFAPLFYELRACHKIVSDQFKVATGNERQLFDDAEIDVLEFAYTIFFYGVGIFSEKQFLQSFNEAEKQLYKNCKIRMVEYQEAYKDAKKQFPDKNFYTVDLPLTFVEDEWSKRFYFLPFNGHADLLGHYYRHLYLTLTYIRDQDDNFLTFEKKYPYAKILRAQLSSFEQLLIYYNASAWFEPKWKEFLTGYRLIKNIPHGLADFGIPPLKKYELEIVKLRLEKNIEIFENYHTP